MELHHYGFATSDILASANIYETLGYIRKSEVITDTIQQVRLLFLQKDEEPMIELVEPLQEKSPVTKILQKNGPTLYHSCFEVPDMNAAISKLKGNQFIVIVKPVPATAFNNRLISFLYHKHLGLIELVQKNNT
ncbi:MAG: lactoylglutathione lyase [Chitinophagaceae bacterium]|nr:MAG: lactoylglutathione lyase [Chitinophagaceae bacterium]